MNGTVYVRVRVRFYILLGATENRFFVPLVVGQTMWCIYMFRIHLISFDTALNDHLSDLFTKNLMWCERNARRIYGKH